VGIISISDKSWDFYPFNLSTKLVFRIMYCNVIVEKTWQMSTRDFKIQTYTHQLKYPIVVGFLDPYNDVTWNRANVVDTLSTMAIKSWKFFNVNI
jgi:hypothetical protein